MNQFLIVGGLALVVVISVVIPAQKARYDGLKKKTEALEQVVSSKDLEIQKLNGTIQSQASLISLQRSSLEVNVAEINDLKNTVANIKPKEIPVFEKIIVTEPTKVVVEKANETTNESLRAIVESANDFNSVLDNQ